MQVKKLGALRTYVKKVTKSGRGRIILLQKLVTKINRKIDYLLIRIMLPRPVFMGF